MLRKIILCILLFSASYSLTSAQVSPSASQSKFYLVKTNRLLGVAHMTVKRTQNFTGDLALAVRHQRKAIGLYQGGAYSKAILHSKQSRLLCIKIFNENKIKHPMDAKFTTEEETYTSSGDNTYEPLDDESLKDQELMQGNLTLDIK